MVPMKQHIFLFISVLSICMSCKKVYNPDINPPQDVLVVDGIITNEIKTYWIRLTMSSAFDNPSSGYKFVTSAKLSISDNLGNNYKVTEYKNGMYFTDSTELVGIPGRIYTLHIETEDGNIYESSPQEMMASASEDTVYAENTIKTVLVPDAYGQYNQITTAGIDLLTDINPNGDILPRFRFKSSITTESSYSKIGIFLTINYYWWETRSGDDLVNLTGEKYTTASTNIQGHVISFIPTEYNVLQSIEDTTISAYVINRIIKVSKYRLNNEAYQYYKNINLLLSATGKIFDPIATQFKGNIICINNPQKLALGFFETSSVKTEIFTSRPGETKVYQIQKFSPPSSNGFLMYL